jgi:hypothetical protein
MKIIIKNEVKELTIWNIKYARGMEVDMTCFQGEFNLPYKDIVKVFGKETTNGDGYKVQAEWHIVTEDGVATIYDYKEGKSYCGKDGIPKSKVTRWHIGGASNKVVPHILKALNIK